GQAKNSLRGQVSSRLSSDFIRTSGRSWVNMKKCSGSIPASRVAERSRTRWRKAPVAAWPASIQPPNAITSVVKFAGGSRSNSTWSIVVLSAVESALSKARLRRIRCQLQLVRPAGFVLGVQVIKRFGDLHGIHHGLGILAGPRQRAGARRVDEAVDHDVGHVHAVLGVFLREHLRQGAHHDTRIVERLSGQALAATQRELVVRNEERAGATLPHGGQYFLGDQERAAAGDVLGG